MSQRRKIQILVIGHNENGCSEYHKKIAYQTGYEIAKKDCVLISGGLEGVMQASCNGAKDAGGIVIGIIPQKEHSFANQYCDIVIPSGMGLMRDFLTALSADAVIIIGGGSGTLAEACAAYAHDKPMVAIKKTGGIADLYADKYLDYRKSVKIVGVDSSVKAVMTVLRKIKKARTTTSDK